jgi:hypothetical protein
MFRGAISHARLTWTSRCCRTLIVCAKNPHPCCGLALPLSNHGFHSNFSRLTELPKYLPLLFHPRHFTILSELAFQSWSLEYVYLLHSIVSHLVYKPTSRLFLGAMRFLQLQQLRHPLLIKELFLLYLFRDILTYNPHHIADPIFKRPKFYANMSRYCDQLQLCFYINTIVSSLGNSLR